jgi:tRNA(Ile)-lysidine synthase
VTAEVAGKDAVRAVYVHHGQAASDRLAGAAESIADSVGIPFSQVAVDVPAGASFEGRAREVRLAALAAAADDDEWIVTGHHADDSVETVLSNLLRGAGATGLAGISARRDRWIRPLVDVDRRTIRSAAKDLGFAYLDDPANADMRHRRNVIRSEMLPWLEERFERRMQPVIKRSADSLAVDDAELRAAAESVPIRHSAGAVTVPAVVLATVSPSIGARVVREALRVAHPPYPGNADDVAAVLRIARSGGPGESLSGGLIAEREGPLVAIYAGGPEPPPEAPLAPGSSVRFGLWRIGMSAPGAALPPSVGRVRAFGDAAVLGKGAIVRSAAEGERIDIGEGSKAVRDAMAEAMVPVRLRRAWPVVAVGGKIAWVAGVRVAGWAGHRQADKPAVELSIEGIEE